MSYELIFWHQTPAQTKSPLAGTDGQHADGLTELPVEEILSSVMRHFPGTKSELNRPAEWLSWVSSNGRDSFEVTWSRQHFRIDCRRLHSDHMNQLVEIGAEFGCPLFDPQINERFNQAAG
jgi:hypothetical protein